MHTMSTDSPAHAGEARTAVQELNHWFFELYLPSWIAMGANAQASADGILDYWGTPLHAASVNMTRCLMSGKEVIGLLRANQDPLQAQQYTHTVVLDRRVLGYNQNAGSIDVIWSRRRADESEIERRAVHFEIHRTAQGWRVVAIASQITGCESLDEIWEAA